MGLFLAIMVVRTAWRITVALVGLAVMVTYGLVTILSAVASRTYVFARGRANPAWKAIREEWDGRPPRAARRRRARILG